MDFPLPFCVNVYLEIMHERKKIFVDEYEKIVFNDEYNFLVFVDEDSFYINNNSCNFAFLNADFERLVPLPISFACVSWRIFCF